MVLLFDEYHTREEFSLLLMRLNIHIPGTNCDSLLVDAFTVLLSAVRSVVPFVLLIHINPIAPYNLLWNFLSIHP